MQENQRDLIDSMTWCSSVIDRAHTDEEVPLRENGRGEQDKREDTHHRDMQ
jgi:hypothetical protein